MITLPDPASDDADGELLALVGRGSVGAFAVLYDRLAPIVHGLACAQHADAEAAAAATGAAFIAIWRLAPRYEPASQDASRWLLAVARHSVARPAPRSDRPTRGRSRAAAAPGKPAARPSSGQPR